MLNYIYSHLGLTRPSEISMTSMLNYVLKTTNLVTTSSDINISPAYKLDHTKLYIYGSRALFLKKHEQANFINM
jgi:hypothetical protein